MHTNIAEVEDLISRNTSVVDFGTAADAVSDEWVGRAEAQLNRTLPPSYKWFLKNYAGGEIGGEEIYSIYGLPFETVNGGDIVSQHLRGCATGLHNDSQLTISETDFGEVFFFDLNTNNAGEYPIYLRLPSGEQIKYANDFYEFLKKRIVAHTG
ncbi:MAG: SMI1/KNR4 family protein [Gammaproteobacteria bacterium]